jgi:hypothetical protein
VDFDGPAPAAVAPCLHISERRTICTFQTPAPRKCSDHHMLKWEKYLRKSADFFLFKRIKGLPQNRCGT